MRNYRNQNIKKLFEKIKQIIRKETIFAEMTEKKRKIPSFSYLSFDKKFFWFVLNAFLLPKALERTIFADFWTLFRWLLV